MPSFMKSRQWLVTIGLTLLVVATLVGSFLTRDLGSAPSSRKSTKDTGPALLVDERPLQTARAMSKLASGSDEQQVADQAEQLADNEVDLAFHDASRNAADHPPQAKPEFKELYQHAGEVEAQVKTDQDSVDRLKKQVAAATGARQDALQEQLDVAQAQLELDQDELGDAKEDLVRSGADPGALIQRQFEQHQAVEHAADEKPAQPAANRAEVNYRASNLLSQFAAWRALGAKISQLQQARDETAQSAAALSKAHDALEKQVTAEKTRKQASSPGTSSATIKSLHILSDDQKNLADLDKRIQDEQELGNAYGSWIALVQTHQRAALHGMNQSLFLILLVLLGVYLADRVVGHYLADIGQERTRLHTLRAVIRFAMQAVGVLLILLVILGAPNQTPTIIGLAGAGLTVALKDFIVAFFGWFVLMGKNGMRVGDWVEINGVAGEVIEINLLRTVLLETGNWATTGHPTGRKVAFVNSYAIEGHFFNFTTSGQWLWDEMQLAVPANQDPNTLLDAVQQAVTKETEASARAAEEEWRKITTRYRVREVSAAPAVNLRPTPSGVELHVRYITRANERYAMRARLNQTLVQLLRRKGIDEKESLSATH
jgi:small-conductance mechanosensitive channel